jgi:sterol-4alpha-carboxylate 3-dehydrogenase (decarboxylating)
VSSKYPESQIINIDHVFPSLRARYPNYDLSSTKIHALDLRCTRNRYAGCTYHEADITDPSSLSTVFSTVKPDIVINTASPHFDADPAILRKVNIDGTRCLLEVARDCPSVKIFVHTSSSSVVHDGLSQLHGVDEEWPLQHENKVEYYSETKVHAEEMVLEANGSGAQKMLTCAVRPAGIIGEGDMSGFAYSVTKTASMAPSWQMHLQLGENDNLFDNTYVGNVAYGLLCAAAGLQQTVRRRDEGKSAVLDMERIDGEAFNVTNNEPAYFWDLARFLWSRYGREINIQKVWALPEQWAVAAGWGSEVFAGLTGRKPRYNRKTARYASMVRYFRCDKLMARTGYKPVVPVQEALERTVRWFKEIEEEDRRTESEGKKKQ